MPAHVQSRFQQALASHKAGQLAQARSLYEDIIKQHPGHADAHHFLGVIAHQSNDHARAVELIGKAIALFPDNPAAYLNRGLAFHALKHFEPAIASYDKAIALKPDFTEAIVGLGDAQLELRRFAAAVGGYDRAISLNPGLVTVHFNRGLALFGLGQFSKAAASYASAIALKPDLAEAHFNRGNALKELRQLDEALKSYSRVLELQPDNIEAKRNIFWLHFVQMKDAPLIERLSADISAWQVKVEIEKLTALKTMADFRVLHDLEQTDHLLALGYEFEGLREANSRLKQIYARCGAQGHGEDSKPVTLGADEIVDITRFRKNAPRYHMSGATAHCLNPNNDWAAIEDRYFSSEPEIIHFDDFLSSEALTELRKFCLISTAWKLEFKNQYLGMLAEGGFVSPLHLGIAKELRQKMPRIFGDQRLEQLWAFKYTSTLGSGINVHADYARVNLNFWVTPDAANLDPDSGGLIVYDVPAPLSWGFEEYNNNDSQSIYRFLKESGAGRRKIPYKCNRAVLFNSRLFHETDAIRFKDGYENRRINVTYLFGQGLGAR